MSVTVRGTDILFNDGTTQSTAAFNFPSSFGAIGTVAMVANASTSNIAAGATIAGSSLIYQSTVTAYGTAASTNLYFSENTSTGLYPNTTWEYYLQAVRSTTSNSGFVIAGSSTLSGTWRVLNPIMARSYLFDGYLNVSVSKAKIVLAVRIA